MKQKRTGVLICQALIEKYGWKEGDRAPLKSLLSANREYSPSIRTFPAETGENPRTS
jgi:hypothetical protein